MPKITSKIFFDGYSDNQLEFSVVADVFIEECVYLYPEKEVYRNIQ